MIIFTRKFWGYAGERATKTVVQTALSALTVGGLTGILAVAWIPLAGTVALAGVVSVLTSYLSYTPATVLVPVSEVV